MTLKMMTPNRFSFKNKLEEGNWDEDWKEQADSLQPWEETGLSSRYNHGGVLTS